MAFSSVIFFSGVVAIRNFRKKFGRAPKGSGYSLQSFCPAGQKGFPLLSLTQWLNQYPISKIPLSGRWRRFDM